MKKAIVFAVAVLGAFLAFADAGIEVAQSTDLARKNTAISWQFTECCDTAVRLSVKRNGEDFDVSGWDTSLVLGGTSSGCVVEGVATGYGTILFAVPACSMPTNGKYTVQITAMKDRRSEEWARGTLRVNANPGMEYMPTCWMGYQKVAKLAASMLTMEFITNSISPFLSGRRGMSEGFVSSRTNLCFVTSKSSAAGVPNFMPFAWDMTNSVPMVLRNAMSASTFTTPDGTAENAVFTRIGDNGEVETFNPTNISGKSWFVSAETGRKFLVTSKLVTDFSRDMTLGTVKGRK